MSKAVASVVVPALIFRFFNVPPGPVAKLNVEVAPSVRLDVLEPMKVPVLLVMPPVTVNVLLPIVNVAAGAISSVPPIEIFPVNTG